MFFNNIKIAFRSLRSNKVFSLINITGLSIAMAATLLIFLWAKNEFSYNTFHQDYKQIYRTIIHFDLGEEVWHWSSTPYPMAQKVEDQIPEVEMLTRVNLNDDAILSFDGKGLVKESHVGHIDTNWFKIFNYEVIAGGFNDFNNTANSAGITKQIAEKYFGDTDPIGKTIEKNEQLFTINLVLEDNPSNSSLPLEIFLPFEAGFSEKEKERRNEDWGNFNFLTFMKLHPNAVSEEIASKITTIFSDNREKDNIDVELEALADLRFSQIVDQDDYEHQSKTVVYFFIGIGLIILFTAGLNYISLSTALISKRIKEIGIKKVIGGSFQHIFTQIFTESILVTGFSCLIAIGLVQFCLPFLGSFMNVSLKLILSDFQVWFTVGIVFLFSLLVSGIYPAFLFGFFKPIRLLRGTRETPKRASLRKVLVVTQFSLAIIILISSIIIYQQMRFLQTRDVGYSRENIICVNPNLFVGNFTNNFKDFARFCEQISSIPELEQLATTDAPLINIRSLNSGSFSWEGMPTDFRPTYNSLRADEQLLKVFDLDIIAGRWFSSDFESDENKIVINEKAIKEFNIPAPIIGKKINFRGKEGQIIGVIKDFNFHSLHKKINPLIIKHNGDFTNIAMAKVSPTNELEAIQKLEATFKDNFKHIPFEYNFLDDMYASMYEEDKKISQLFQFFSALLIFISCLGLFGLSTFSVETRTKEIGIRKVLGASAQLIVGLLSKDFLRLVLIALVIASPIAWFVMLKWLDNYAFSIQIEWWMIAIAAVLSLSTAFLTVSSQSIRAAVANPVESLRAE